MGSSKSQDQTVVPQPPGEEADLLEFEATAHVERSPLPVSAPEVEREGVSPSLESKSVLLAVKTARIVSTSDLEATTCTVGAITSTSASSTDSQSSIPDSGSGMESDAFGLGADTTTYRKESSSAGQKPETESLELLSSRSLPETGSDNKLFLGGGPEGSHWATPMKKPLIEEITSPSEEKRARLGSELVLEDLECDDDDLRVDEPQSKEELTTSTGLRLADVPNITDEAEFRRVEAAFDRINRSPAGELSVEDKIWLVAAKGGSTLKDEQLELDSGSRQRVRERLEEAGVVDKVSLAF